MCVLDNTAQRRGQGKKQGHLEDSWHVAWSMEDCGLRISDCGLRKARGQRSEVRGHRAEDRVHTLSRHPKKPPQDHPKGARSYGEKKSLTENHILCQIELWSSVN